MMPPALMMEHDDPSKPKISVRWRDFVARTSPVRDEAQRHYGITVAPWGLMAWALAGFMAGGLVSEFQHPQWTHWGWYLGLAFNVACIWLIGLVASRSIVRRRHEEGSRD